ncbi:MAG: endopeptidase La [Desulfobacterales bacterium]|nr:endopeptidase La [Desulfobacterales bacterium]
MTETNPDTKGSGVNPATLPIPDELPVLPISDFVFFPGMGFPLQFANSSSKQLIDDALLNGRMVAIVARRKPKEGEPESAEVIDELFSVGVAAYIHKMIKAPEGFYVVLMSAFKKIRIREYTQHKPYLKARIEVVEMKAEQDRETEALLLNLRNQFKKLAELSQLPVELPMTIMSMSDPFFVGFLVVSQLNLPLEEEQKILELDDLKALLRIATSEINKKMETVEMSRDIQKAIKEDMDDKQREFFLRQQLKAIRKELGEDNGKNVELEELRKRLDESTMGEEPRKAAEKELERLARINPSSPEHTVSRTYLEWILDLPWEVSTVDSLDIDKARKNLDQDHYGLEKIKKRILEFLAVRKLKQDMHGPILCFVGPPGVGKTSLGQSIARTMGRKFVRISLGGVRDEAEIRGHRRTYIGALPGRIIQSLRKAGSNNPLFMLDEIDKLGTDFRGDPSSALLEVLDPEQNFSFADHYLEIAFDLSRVMFITTANLLDNIPGPLRDRMEVIELPGYTDEEKLMIAKRHLVGKQLEAHALTGEDLQLTDAAILGIIHSYTREAGVRNLERRLAEICRGVAKNIVTGATGLTVVDADDLEQFLGPVRFFSEMTTRSWGPGLATGLAWTPVGGQLLFIESARMPGRGKLTLTGKLGEVMKESATAALTFIRSHAAEMKIEDELFAKSDIHIHVPEGAIPKDGPSAGVAMVVSLVSLLTGRAARKDIAMTGEITLRGDVLPVGGIKEKVLAAVRAGLRVIILPALNEKDVGEIPDNVKEGVVFHYVQGIREALGFALNGPESPG